MNRSSGPALVAPLGSCRIYDPLRAAEKEGRLVVMRERLYGFTHSLPQHVQQLGVMRGVLQLPPGIVRYAADHPDIWLAARESKESHDLVKDVDQVVVEVCSRKLYTLDGWQVKSNDAMGDLVRRSPDHRRWWATVGAGKTPDDALLDAVLDGANDEEAAVLKGLRAHVQTEDEIRQAMRELWELLEGRVAWACHFSALGDDTQPIAERERVRDMVRRCAADLGQTVFDPNALVAAAGADVALSDSIHYAPAFIPRVGRSLADHLEQLPADWPQPDEPPAYRVIATHRRSDEDRIAARAGLFEVFGATKDTLVPPVDWAGDPHDSTIWQVRLHDFRWMDALLQAEGDEEAAALRQAVALVLDWVLAHPSPSTGSPKAWSDKVVGDRLPFFAYVLRQAEARGLADDRTSELLLASIVEQAEWLADDTHYEASSNHGLFQDAGLLLVAGHYLPDHPRSRAWWDHATERLLGTLDRHLAPSGVHLEHSPGYHIDLLRLLDKIANRCRLEDPRLDRVRARMSEVLGFLCFPDGRPVPIGDTNHAFQLSARELELVARASGTRSWTDGGYAVVRDGEAHLVMTTGYHSHVHKHADDLSFCLFDRGVLVVTDAGTQSYDAGSPERRFVLSEESHNGLAVDEERHVHERLDAHGGGGLVGVSSDGDWHVITADATVVAALGVRHRRWIVLRPGHVAIVVDAVDGDDAHVYRRWLHFGPTLRLADDGTLTRDGVAFGAVRDCSSCEVEQLSVRGREEPLQGFVWPDYGTPVAVDTLELSSTRQQCTFVSVIGLDPSAAASAEAVVDDDRALRVLYNEVELSVAADGVGFSASIAVDSSR